jgi:hypothetical protein
MLKFTFALLLLLFSLTFVSSRYWCREHDRYRDECPDSYSPVCGYKRRHCDDDDDSCKRTYSNKCEACKHWKIKYVEYDECYYEEEDHDIGSSAGGGGAGGGGRSRRRTATTATTATAVTAATGATTAHRS